MEETKKEKILRRLKIFAKVIGYFIVAILVVIGLFLVFYFVSGKSAEKKGHKQLVGLYTIISPSMTPIIKPYDVVLTYRVDDPNDLKIGDVITFYSTNDFFGGIPITHRIKDIRAVPNVGTVYITKGDANGKEDKEQVYFNNIVGKVVIKIPQLGKVQFFLASKGGWIIVILIPSLAVISYDIYKIFKLILLKNKMLSLRNKHGNL